MTITMKVEGLEGVMAALRELPDATAKNVMKRVLLKRAEPFAETARRLVPVDQGHLKNSIHVATKLTKRQKGRHRKVHRDDVEVFVGPGTDPAAHLQEYGTSRHPAQPFMRPAFDQNKDAFFAGVGADMWAEIEKAATRLAKKSAKAALKG
jgi:HK97 gp10 family phage protein